MITGVETAALVAAILGAVALAGTLFRALRRSRRDQAAAGAVVLELTERIASLERGLGARDTVLAAMGEGVWLFDAAGRRRYGNRAALAIVGRRFDTIAEISPPVLREAVLEVRGDDDGGTEPITRQFETAGRAVEATALGARPPGSVVVVLRDVTQARSLERLRRDFVANASHELKTPVASILALLSALRSAAPDDPEAMTSFLPLLDQEAERLVALVNDLLDLSRLESGAPERKELGLDRIAEAVARRLRRRAEAAGLRLNVVADERVVVAGSATDLAQLVENLLDNAIRYTPDGGEVRLLVRRLQGAVQLTVEDTGIGIESRDLHRVFERFYRTDSARSRATGGTGLGLSIVRHIAEAHGGAVRCESILGAGSQFIVRLPLARG